jgi:hypothetical protein
MKSHLAIFLIVAMSSFAIVMGPDQVFSNTSGCVKCHTDEAALKSQFIPPKITVEEGEG